MGNEKSTQGEGDARNEDNQGKIGASIFIFQDLFIG